MISMFKNLLAKMKLNAGEIEKEGELTAEMAAAAYSGDTVKFLDDLIALLQEFRAQKVAAIAAANSAPAPATIVVPVAPTVVVVPPVTPQAAVFDTFAPIVPSTTVPIP